MATPLLTKQGGCGLVSCAIGHLGVLHVLVSAAASVKRVRGLQPAVHRADDGRFKKATSATIPPPLVFNGQSLGRSRHSTEGAKNLEAPFDRIDSYLPRTEWFYNPQPFQTPKLGSRLLSNAH